jgi:hypothetical protein
MVVNLNLIEMKKIILTAVLLSIVLISCSEINMDNYKKIKPGMSKQEVIAILGEGESDATSSYDMGEYGGNITNEVMTWQSGVKVIVVSFSNDKVDVKSQNGL